MAADRSAIYVQAPDAIRDWVRRRFGSTLNATAALTDPGVRRVELVAADEIPALDSPEAARSAGPRLVHEFDTFVVGAANRFAHAAALAVAEQPGQAYNPLLIYGPAGVGKTHLLQAVGAYARRHNPALPVHYSTVEAFTTEFLRALRGGDLDSFKHTYRHAGMLLLLDDVQFLDGKTKTAEEFFHTLDAATGAGTQVVMTADGLPSDMPTLDARLRERLQAGLLVDLQAPDLETRTAIVRKLAALHGAGEQPLEVLDHVARRITSNVRVLQGALTRLAAYASLTGSPLSLELADRVLSHLYGQSPASSPVPRSISIVDIKAEVASTLSIDVEALASTGRSRRLVYARQVAMHLCRELTDLSLPAIADHFGGRDHTTVLHAHRKIKQLLLTDDSTRVLITELIDRLSPTPTLHSQ